MFVLVVVTAIVIKIVIVIAWVPRLPVASRFLCQVELSNLCRLTVAMQQRSSDATTTLCSRRPSDATEHVVRGSAIRTARGAQDAAEHVDRDSAIATEHRAANTTEQGFVHDGQYYAGVAAMKPVFIPPKDFFIPQPQLWVQCACANDCYRCARHAVRLRARVL